jgi:hypothetical protein
MAAAALPAAVPLSFLPAFRCRKLASFFRVMFLSWPAAGAMAHNPEELQSCGSIKEASNVPRIHKTLAA